VDKVAVGQERQRRPGPCPIGTIPFRVMCRDWCRTDYWIVESLLGAVLTMSTAEILECPLAKTGPSFESRVGGVG
jgi:hypothetical protein